MSNGTGFSESIVGFVGYHATTARNALGILQNGFQRKSEGNRHWLGDGYYFFESSEGWARWWTHRGIRGESAVLRAEISVARDAVLDLLDYDDMERFHAFRRKLIEQLKLRGKRVRIRKPFDGYVINIICKDGGIQLVRAAFTEPDEHRDSTVQRNESRIRRIHVQLCCRDTQCIKHVSKVDAIA